MSAWQPKTGQKCHCRPGVHRDNCPDCEGTGWRIDFRAIRMASKAGMTRENMTHLQNLGVLKADTTNTP